MKTDLQFKEDSKLIHEYLKAIKKKLRPHTKAEKKYLTELKNAMYDYAESSGDKPITMEELIEKFGEPKECANQYNVEFDTTHPDSKSKRLTAVVISLVLFIALIITICFTIFLRSEFEDSRNSEISAARATSTKSASKTVVFQNANGDVLWQVTLDATFRYNGSTSVCTAANASTQTFSSSWKTRVSSCSKSQNRAYASAYGNRYSVKGKLLETVTQNVTLTCSKTGAIS